MDQSALNFALAATSALLGWLGKTVWQNVRELTDDLGHLREEIAKDYIRKDDFYRVADRLFEKLDLIFEKLDNKQDK